MGKPIFEHRLGLLVIGAAFLVTCHEDSPPTALRQSPARALMSVSATDGAVLVGAGDIGSCTTTNDDATGRLLDSIPGTVFTTGDNAYTSGTATQYTTCYDPAWGRHKARTQPSPGEHDYLTTNASGYFGYFGPAAGDSTKGYYSYDLGSWHVVVLNSGIAMNVGSPQEQWLRADLAASSKTCTVAYWHHPLFYSMGASGVNSSVKPLWDALYANGAELVLNAHYRVYERFIPQTSTGLVDTAYGIREIIVGTGGAGVNTFDSIRPNSQVRSSGTPGVLKVTLNTNSYNWQFVPIAGKTFTDSGTTACHGTPPPIANAGGPYQSAGTVTFNGTASSDPQGNIPLTYAWDFGDGTTGTGATPSHTYASYGVYTVTLTVTNSKGTASSPATTTATIQFVAPVLVGAGDIGSCTTTNDDATGRLLDGIPGTVFTTGDNAYTSGTATQYTTCYDPAWGRHKARTQPSVGEHDYLTTNASGYFGYFGPAAGDSTKGYYSYDLSTWHVVVLNSAIAMNVGSPQEQWLRADLAASSKTCTVAYWHHPLYFSIGASGVNSSVKPLWDALYAYGAELVLNAHYRVYERFIPQTSTGLVDTSYGIREIIVGTGGAGLNTFDSIRPNSQVHNSGTPGVLKVTLNTYSYNWQFVPIAGKTFTDSGTTACHGAPPPIAVPGGPYQSEGTITFNGTASFDPQGDTPLTYAWDFGDGTTGTGATPTHQYASYGVYTVTLTVTDSKGNVGNPATTTVTVQNYPPSVNAGPGKRTQPGATVNIDVRFSDPGGSTDKPFTYTIDWGDGLGSTGTVDSQTVPLLASHVYGALGTYAVQTVVFDKNGGSGSDSLTVLVEPPGTPEVFIGAGDIAACNNNRDQLTAQILDTIPGTVFTLGDNAYPNGAAADYANCYQPAWGRHKDRTYASMGNHDYMLGNANAGFDYFGGGAGPRGTGYYSFDLSDWHIIVLNDNIAGSAQDTWIQNDLATNTKQCTLAIWHQPRFYSSLTTTTVSTSNRNWWAKLYNAGADVIVNGHAHFYERFALQTPDGIIDSTRGIKEFIVGTGGEDEWIPTTIAANSEVRASVYGVLKLTLSTGAYTWQFIPIPGQAFADSGSGTCH